MQSIPLIILIAILSLSGCRTVEVPLGAVMVGRPHTLGSKAGIRGTVGTVQTPKVQGVVDEVVDTEGKVINPLGVDSTSDSRLTLPLVELGVGFANKFEIGLSTNRGFNGMVDVYRGDLWTVSLSAASMHTSVSSGKKTDDQKTEEENEAEKTKTGDTFKSLDDISGKARNTNLTLLTSVRMGNQVWAQLSLYGGVGINKFAVEITDNDTVVTKTKSQYAPSALIGIQGKLTIFEISAEAAMIKIRERDNRDHYIHLALVSATTRFDWF